MIRQSPEVPGAVELTDVARHVMNHQFVYVDPKNRLVWQGSEDYAPNLKVIVSAGNRHMRNGRYLVSRAVLVVIDGLTEYELGLPVVGASQIPDDPYIEDFVHAFRQYQDGRSNLEPDFAEAV